MSNPTFKGAPLLLEGKLPAAGSKAPAFSLARRDLSEVTLDSLKGHKVLLNIFPSIDTPVCKVSVHQFNSLLEQHKEIKLLNISMDLPFAFERFCIASSLPDAETLSAFRSSFGKDYGVQIATGPLQGLFARSFLVIDENGSVVYSELVSELTHEPDYAKALEQLAIHTHS